jgi:hypothetical protein
MSYRTSKTTIGKDTKIAKRIRENRLRHPVFKRSKSPCLANKICLPHRKK